jgi:hypothetical protein
LSGDASTPAPLVLKLALGVAVLGALPWLIVSIIFVVAALGLYPCETECPTQPLLGWGQLALTLLGTGLAIASLDELGHRRLDRRRDWTRGAWLVAGTYYSAALWWLITADSTGLFPY